MLKNIVVAIDSYKGSASSQELNKAVELGILEVLPNCTVKTFEISDGGEGTVLALNHGLGGHMVEVETVDLLHRPTVASYLLYKDKAFIEAAEVVGIDKIKPDEHTFQSTTSFGLAKLFLDAKQKGAKEITLSLGGTGTSDGGLGLLQGLGVEVNNLIEFSEIDFSKREDFSGIQLTALADITNPFAGDHGFVKYFGKQKGGTAELIEIYDKKAQEFANYIKRNHQFDLQKIPGTGAAGGLGAAISLLGGTIEPGFSKIAKLLKIEKEIIKADLVITGEGKLDNQTAHGKVPYGMAKLAREHGVPTLAFCGTLNEGLGEMEELLLAAFSIQHSPLSLEKAMDNGQTCKNIKRLTKNIIRTLTYKDIKPY